MKIYYLSSSSKIDSESKKKLEKLGDLILLSTRGIPEEEIINQIQDAEILLLSPSAIQKITNVFFESLYKLKHLALLSSGFDWVDISSATKHNITVSYCKGANAESVAEYTWAMLLGLVRGLYQEGINIEGEELFGKTIGILGTGSIGEKVARIAKAFNMRTLGFNKSHKRPKYFDEIVDLEILLASSDFISINLPLTSETEGLIGENEISKMKSGAYLVNTAREEIVDTKAVLTGIESGKIYGYGVDLNITNELLKSENPYLKYKNIISIPHRGYNTKEAKKRMLSMAVKNIKSFTEGKSINLISV